ncbi:MAG: hypothetical protein ACRDTI_05610 [Mycobacterium sp.]
MGTIDQIRQRCLERLALPEEFTDNDLAYELDRLKEIEEAATALLTAVTSGPDDQDISEFLQLLFKLSAALNPQ